MNILSNKISIFIATTSTAVYFAFLMHTESQIIVGLLVLIFGAVWFAGDRFGVLKKLDVGIKYNRRFSSAMFIVAIIGVAAYFHDNHFNLLMLTTVMVFVIACLGLNLQFGYSGLLNFAGAAFFGAGGYTAAVLTNNTQIPHLLVLLYGGIVAILIGFVLILPVLRTRGHYAAVVTIAFSLLFRTLVEVSPALGGAQGSAVKGLKIWGWEFNKNIEFAGLDISFYMNYFALALILLLIAIAFSKAVERSWVGLNFDTIRLDETAAACFGVNIKRWKITAFAMGNFFLGVIGAFYGMMLGFIAPNNFTFSDSLIMVSIILLGGIGSIPGIILASTIVIILPEKLQGIQEYRFLIFAVGVIFILLFRPNGLIKRQMRQFPKAKGQGEDL